MNRHLACLVLACFGLVACQPLYGAKPERLHHPERKRRPPATQAEAAPIKYVDECATNFRDDPKAVHPREALSRQLVDQGNTSLVSAEKAKQDTEKVGLLKDAIAHYRDALVRDPFNVEATLRLAVAYDKVLRKGCALAMLKRLSDLAHNPKWASEASRDIDSIDDNAQWFKGYRKDAMAAVGR